LGLVALLFLTQIVSAATIKGTVYDFSLEETNAIVEIDTNPPQRFVAKPEYIFQISPGTYLLTATKYKYGNLVATTSEIITIKEEGSFAMDLILFPELEIVDLEPLSPEDIILENYLIPSESEEENQDENQEEKNNLTLPFLVILIGFGGFILFKLFRKKPGIVDEEQEIFYFISKERTVTQREIRSKFPFSEAKISLIITALQKKGLIKKIKKGRGNIIMKI